MSNCVKRETGRAEVRQRPRCFDSRDSNVVSNLGRIADDGVMRAGEAENAVRAAGMIRDAGGNLCGALTVMQAKLKGWRAVASVGRQREPAKRDQQALGGHGIRNDDAEERPPQPQSFVVMCPPVHHGRMLASKDIETKGTRGFMFGKIRRTHITSAACA
jgi:hypothetical protein